MFGAFKRLFSKPAEPETPPAPAAKPQLVKPVAPAPVAPTQPKASPAAPAPPPAAPMATPIASPPAASTPEAMITLPLAPILAALPPNLSALSGPNKAGTFSLPAKTALAQLASGAVKIPFGDLRQGSPPGTFTDNSTQDRSLVSLPLAQVLAAMDPALLARRSGQKVATVPESVTSIFGKNQSFSAKAAVNLAPAAALEPDAPIAFQPATPAAEQPAVPAYVQPPAPKPAEPSPAPKPPVSAPIPTPPEVHTPIAPAPAPAAGISHFTIRPAAPTLPSAAAKTAATAAAPAPGIKPPPGVPQSSAFAKPPGSSPLPSAFAKPPGSSPLPSAFAKPPGASPLPSATPKGPTPGPMPFAAPKAPALPHPASAPTPAAEEPDAITAPLSALKSSWPLPVQQEIEQLNLGGSTVSLPVQKLDAGMKTGRVVFTWKELSLCLPPAPAGISPDTAETALELPLSVIAPLFLAHRRPGAAQKKVAIGANIPDLFAGMAKASEAPSPVEAPAAAIRPAAAPAAPAPPPVDALGEIFGQPGKSDWPPQQIIQKICGLKGVAGSALTMSDGLLLTGQMPPPLKPDTVAAFLPQIFGRVNQSAGEMQLGSLTSLVLTAGAAQCALYKTGKLYLAVLGRPGEPLPEAVLERIAAELAKRNP